MASTGPIVRVDDLRVTFPTMDGNVHAVKGLSFEVPQGGALGIVGESGSGKSVTSLSLMGLHRGTQAQITGTIEVAGTDVTGASDKQLQQMRGNDIAMVFQDPMQSLHPQYTIGNQLIEAYRVHNPRVSGARARKKAIESLDRVGIPEPGRRINSYPHEFSGGMRQRVVIAMGLMCDPKVLLADEPTTALDVTVQAEVLGLIRRLRAEHALSVLMISHDLAVLAHSCEYLYVFRDGVIVEAGPTDQVLRAPQHPYTRELVADHTVFGIEAVRRAAEEAAEEEAEAQTGVRQP